MDTKEDVAEKQISFIIMTRDNNKPDAYGHHSTTHAPCTWPAVAAAYNAKFRAGQPAVGSAAMEKRARKHRESWMAARPKYPRIIVYAPKAAVHKGKGNASRETKEAEQVARRLKQGDKVGILEQEVITEQDEECRVNKWEMMFGLERCTRVAGWVPPNAVRNQGMYVPTFSSLAPRTLGVNEQAYFDVVDFQENKLGVVRVRMRDIVETSAFVAEERKRDAHIRMKLQAPSLDAVQRYVKCISPIKSSALSDVEHQGWRNAASDVGPRPVDWEFAALVDLYNVATVLMDSHVRQLVMSRWREMEQQNLEVELDAQALRSLYSNTQPDDAARIFWTRALCAGGVADGIAHAGELGAGMAHLLQESIYHEQWFAKSKAWAAAC
ncbi:hypothetical protein ACEQ8H_005976 [Pleosporales sp. CAS-2024a]